MLVDVWIMRRQGERIPRHQLRPLRGLLRAVTYQRGMLVAVTDPTPGVRYPRDLATMEAAVLVKVERGAMLLRGRDLAPGVMFRLDAVNQWWVRPVGVMPPQQPDQQVVAAAQMLRLVA